MTDLIFDGTLTGTAGSAGTPRTTIAPVVSITRYESISDNTDGGQNGTITVNLTSNNLSTSSQGIGLTIYAEQIGMGDIVGSFHYVTQSGTSNNIGYPGVARAAAYGGFVGAIANPSGQTPDNVAVAWNPVCTNNTGIDTPWVNAAPANIGVMTQANGANLAAACYVVQATPPAAGSQYRGMFDVGFVTQTGSTKTASFVDGSQSIVVMQSATAHTNGIDFSKASFTGDAWQSPGLTIDGSGNITSAGHSANPSPTSGWAYDGSASPLVPIANGATVLLAPGRGFLYIEEESSHHTAMYLIGTGAVILVSQIGNLFAAPTTKPAVGHASVAFDPVSVGYRIYNNIGEATSFRVVGFRIGATA
jgi:hypothetical protein